MRTRDELLKDLGDKVAGTDTVHQEAATYQAAILEILLDIRDLLSAPK